MLSLWSSTAVKAALRVGLFELLLVMSALVFTRREVFVSGQFSSFLLPWQQYVLLVLILVDGLVRGHGSILVRNEYMSQFRKRLLRYLLPVTLFLFVACASLCERVNLGCIKEQWWQDTGLVILAAGIILSAWQQKTRPDELCTAGLPAGGSEMAPAEEKAKTSPDLSEIQAKGPWKLLRYPDRTSVLVKLIGVSMTLSAWMPLFALPGLIIAFKWELADVEAFAISQYGDKYIAYRQKTWFIIPFIY